MNLLLLLSFTLLTQQYQTGDTLHVVAIDGVNVRKTGTGSSPKSGTLANGEKVIILDANQSHTDTLDGFTGHWIKVVSLTNSNLEGYVFDAYLSRFPVPDSFACLKDFVRGTYRWEEDEMRDFLPDMLEEYIQETFYITGPPVIFDNNLDSEGALHTETTPLNHNARMIRISPSEGSGIELEFENARISEVYYLIKNLMKALPQHIGGVQDELIKSPLAGKKCVGPLDFGCTIQVERKKNGRIALRFFNACC